jgi:hypothetical protein
MPGLPREGDRFGRFHLRRLIGRGGRSAVFEAYDPTVRRLVAVKVVLPDPADTAATAGTRERFDREAQLLERLRSSHIVLAHDAGKQDDTFYVVTELAPDGDLSGWLAEDHALAPEPPSFLSENFASTSGPERPDVHGRGVDRRSLVIGLVITLALVGIVVGGVAVARGGSGSPEDEKTDGRQPASTPSEQSAPVSPAAEGTAPAATTAGFLCWNGQQVASSDLCRPIRGSRGMDWVFPGMQGQNCRPRTADQTPGRQVLVECFLHDKQVLIHLSQWDRADKGIAHYRSRENLGEPTLSADGTLYLWNATSPQPDHPYTGVFLWGGHAFSAAIYAASAADLTRVLQDPTLLRPVPDDRYLGTPAS